MQWSGGDGYMVVLGGFTVSWWSGCVMLCLSEALAM